ncbi:MAG: nitrile hydratase subunit alpha [Alphaproteobacteria bacterium]
MSGGHSHPHDHNQPPAPDEERPPLAFEALEVSIRELLIEKGIISADELRATVEFMDTRGEELGARIVARAWTDPAFKERLLRHGDEAVREFGVDMRPTELCVIENTPAVHNLVVCTLCSCYPRPILGVPPAWYKRRDYRARAVREPRKVLAEFGTVLPAGVEVRVHDSNADLRYLVLPRRPDGTEGWSAERLAALVSRDSMVGVALCRRPEDEGRAAAE